jgi:predicted HicB family RNase H-like nuclease
MHGTGGEQMPEKKQMPVRRKIHVDLPEDVHQRLRVKAAMLDMSMQAFVTQVVKKEVADVVLPKIKGGRMS